MKKQKGTPRICENGHRYYKSSNCPVCPVCEKEKRPAGNFPGRLSAPARRALERNGINSAAALSRFTEKEILALHGIGPSSLPLLKSALQAEGLDFAS